MEDGSGTEVFSGNPPEMIFQVGINALRFMRLSGLLKSRYLGKVFFSEKSAHSLPLERVLRLAKTYERHRYVGGH